VSHFTANHWIAVFILRLPPVKKTKTIKFSIEIEQSLEDNFIFDQLCAEKEER